jgi:hypothetical protein
VKFRTAGFGKLIVNTYIRYNENQLTVSKVVMVVGGAEMFHG